MNDSYTPSTKDRWTEERTLHRAQEVLMAAGLVLPRSAAESHLRPLSTAERAELAQQVHGPPLSELIIEEREER
jgi:hypothetical protein